MHNIHEHIEHITRVEGHGNLVINIQDGKIKELRLDIVEAPRFFEAMLVGRSYEEAVHITSRICGICAVTHTTASLKALESAFGIVPDEQTVKLRKLMFNGEIIQSHILHLYILAAPDFLGVKSVFPLIKTNEDIVKRAFRLKGLANDLCMVIGGRHIHPCSMVINGFTNLPKKKDLSLILERFKNTRQDIEETVSLFKNIRLPDFNRKTEYLCLDTEPQYTFYDGDIRSSFDWTINTKLYRDVIKEFVVNNSTAKFARASTDSYMVGALARINNGFDKLNNRAKEIASELGFSPPSFNPFMNNIAQLIEVVQCVDDTIELIEDVLGDDLKARIPVDKDVRIKEGLGVGAVEAPRGTLYHEYEIDEKGIITGANCIIPTAQNLNNIQLDLHALVPMIIDQSKEDIIRTIEMLIRAYDPCISCATHILRVEFEGER